MEKIKKKDKEKNPLGVFNYAYFRTGARVGTKDFRSLSSHIISLFLSPSNNATLGNRGGQKKRADQILLLLLLSR